MERLVAEWLVARTKFVATFVGMSDDEFNSETAPGGWTYRGIAKHLIGLDQDSLKAIHADIKQRGE
jgi:hypothetical protein